MQSANPDGGFGYNLSASEGELRSANGEATWNADHASLDAAVSSVDGETAGRLSASGAIVEMNGSAFLTRNPDGAVALVETGNPNIPIYQENRQVATSDSNGEALLTNLTANSPNRVEIDPTDYSLGTVVTKTEQIVVPRRQSGVVVDLAPSPGRPALVTLRLDDGAAPPVGSRVTLSSGGAPLLLGHDGQVFIPDLATGIDGTVAYPAGSCRFALDALKGASADSIPTIGPITCLQVH